MKYGRENRTEYPVTMVRSVREVAGYTKMHSRCSILISGNPMVPEVPHKPPYTAL